MTLPFPLMVAAWLISASMPPNAEREFDRLFGRESRALAADIRTLKPISMDGYLISFRMSQADYARITSGTFTWQLLGGRSFFGGASRPSSWPAILETMTVCDRRDLGDDVVLAYHDGTTQTVYAAFQYSGW